MRRSLKDCLHHHGNRKSVSHIFSSGQTCQILKHTDGFDIILNVKLLSCFFVQIMTYSIYSIVVCVNCSLSRSIIPELSPFISTLLYILNRQHLWGWTSWGLNKTEYAVALAASTAELKYGRTDAVFNNTHTQRHWLPLWMSCHLLAIICAYV